MFSLDSVITAVGMAQHIPVMVAAILLAVAVMLLAANPLGHFIDANPTIKMLALAFIVLIGVVLILDGFEVHVPKRLHLLRDGFLGAGGMAQPADAPPRRQRQHRSCRRLPAPSWSTPLQATALQRCRMAVRCAGPVLQCAAVTRRTPAMRCFRVRS